MSAPSTRSTNVVGRRVGAAVIDLVIYLLACGAMFLAWGPTTSSTTDGLCSTEANARGTANACFSWNGTSYSLTGGKSIAFLSVLGVLWLLYHGVYQAFSPTTGKRLLRLDVVDGAGARARIGRTMVRSLPLALGTLFVFVGFMLASVIGVVMVLVHPRHRRVGDVLARTFVVDRESIGVRVDTTVRH